MNIILAFLAAHLGGILTVLGGIGAIFAAWLHGKSAGTRQATQAAAGEIAQAQAATQVARSQVADAQAQAAAVQAGADAAAARAVIDNDVSAGTAQEVRDELSGWTKP
ncbi:hypothetical protein B7760_02009 [Burkholderia glumae]|uniref:hypothetical protein n=1 Tax=Burkholderia glumae TaxID=337 RepID=UPI00157B0851|nr:hypothetical protein [Burkholderia glumae]MCR1769073.1 hypothetical protein [Burkholderia glumae]QKM47975.1 hypothetical protein B7760_02009 [Burkholderia glumae]